jgi:hypothetical protein
LCYHIAMITLSCCLGDFTKMQLLGIFKHRFERSSKAKLSCSVFEEKFCNPSSGFWVFLILKNHFRKKRLKWNYVVLRIRSHKEPHHFNGVECLKKDTLKKFPKIVTVYFLLFNSYLWNSIKKKNQKNDWLRVYVNV